MREQREGRTGFAALVYTRVETVSFYINIIQTQHGYFLHICTFSLSLSLSPPTHTHTHTDSSSRGSRLKQQSKQGGAKRCKDCSLLHSPSQNLPSFLSIVVDGSRDSRLSTCSFYTRHRIWLGFMETDIICTHLCLTQHDRRLVPGSYLCNRLYFFIAITITRKRN